MRSELSAIWYSQTPSKAFSSFTWNNLCVKYQGMSSYGNSSLEYNPKGLCSTLVISSYKVCRKQIPLQGNGKLNSLPPNAKPFIIVSWKWTVNPKTRFAFITVVKLAWKRLCSCIFQDCQIIYANYYKWSEKSLCTDILKTLWKYT